MKGTGRWTIQEAAERSTAAPTMAAALDARYLSGRKAERVEAAKTLKGPSTIPKVPKAQLVEDMKAALYCSKICSYAQVNIAFYPERHVSRCFGSVENVSSAEGDVLSYEEIYAISSINRLTRGANSI